MNKTKENSKLTLEEYQKKYSNPENVKAAKTFLGIISTVLAIVILVSLFFVVLKLFDIHEIAGYVGIVAAVLVFIFGYLVPIIKLKNTSSFKTNVNSSNAREAQKYNKKLREDISDKMIDLAYKTEGVSWYSDKNIGKLAVARHTKNEKDLIIVLTEIYTTDVKKAADSLIKKSAVSVGIKTAISQSEVLDTILVIIYQLNLIKNIVYLYGYRPTDTQMAKIYKNVLINSLIAYGASSVTSGVGKSIGSSLVNVIDKVSQSNNFVTSTIGSVVGSLAGTVIESGLQFALNSTLTTIIGFQTKKYLVKEYKLQEMLDTVEILEDDESQAVILEDIKNEIKEQLSKKPKSAKTQPAT